MTNRTRVAKVIRTSLLGLTLFAGFSNCKRNETRPTPTTTTGAVPQNPPVAVPPAVAPVVPKEHVETPEDMLARFNLTAKQLIEVDFPKSHIIVTNWEMNSNDGGHSESTCKNLSTDLKKTDSLINPVIAVSAFDLNYVKVFDAGFAPFHATFHYTLNFKPAGKGWEVISGRVRCTDHQVLEGRDATREQDVDAADISRFNALLKKQG